MRTPEGTYLRPTCEVPNCPSPVPIKGQKCSWHELPKKERDKRRERPDYFDDLEYMEASESDD